jgi:hypothetical protein
MSPAQGTHARQTIVVRCRDVQLARLIGRSAPPTSRVTVFSEWADFERAARGADCAIAVVPWLDEAGATTELDARRRNAPDLPLALLTHSDPANARLLHNVQVDEVLWMNEVRQSLPATIERLLGHAFLGKVARAVEQATRLPVIVREVISTACRHRERIPTASSVSCALGQSRTTVWRAWQRAAPKGLRLEDFFDWLLLFHSLARRGGARSWAQVARELGVHEHTLSRVAARLTGRRLSEFNPDFRTALHARFEEEVLKPLGIEISRNK